MSDIELATPRLWTKAGFQEDEWTHAESVEALAGNRRVILPLKVLLQLGEDERMAAAGRLGVHLLPGEAIDAIVPYLADLALVSLAFPAFNDGRSYSKAQLLRSRHGFHGPIRACGDVLIDQIPLMLRTGFSEFDVSSEPAIRRLEDGHVGGIPFHYQPAAAENESARGYSWRRIPVA